MNARWLAVTTMIVSALTAGCTAQARSPEPVPVDRVECARCRMLISSDANGGQIVSSRDETRFYDDIGCLAADWVAHHAEADAFVRVAGGRWSEARSASYARPEGAMTAMGSGLTAFATIAEARAADMNGRALTFDEVVRAAGEHK